MTVTGSPEAGDVTILPGAYIADGVVVRQGVVIGPNAVVLAATEQEGLPTTLHAGAIIGANATVLPGVQIGQRARIGPGSVVAGSVPPLAIAEGNPARIVGYVDSAPPGVDRHLEHPMGADVRTSLVRDVSLHEFTTVVDIRGRLSAAELGRDIPFQPARFFLVYDVPSTETRGAHAHRRCQQLLVAARGHLSVVADDGEVRQEFLLDSPSLGLHLPALTWGIQYKCSADAVLLVLASHPYDPTDYIRDYAEFVALAREARQG
jgi:hypothetical protein